MLALLASGLFMMQAGYPERAETVYREDLEEFPKNEWSLLGLLQALLVRARWKSLATRNGGFRDAWRHGDVVLTESRF